MPQPTTAPTGGPPEEVARALEALARALNAGVRHQRLTDLWYRAGCPPNHLIKAARQQPAAADVNAFALLTPEEQEQLLRDSIEQGSWPTPEDLRAALGLPEHQEQAVAEALDRITHKAGPATGELATAAGAAGVLPHCPACGEQRWRVSTLAVVGLRVHLAPWHKGGTSRARVRLDRVNPHPATGRLHLLTGPNGQGPSHEAAASCEACSFPVPADTALGAQLLEAAAADLRATNDRPGDWACWYGEEER